MKRNAFLALLCCLVLLSTAALAVPSAFEMDEYVDKAFKGAKTVGGSVVIYSKGELVYARDYGMKRQRQREPVDPNTQFRLASISKMVTGIGLMKLVEEDKLELDTDISKYFGYKIGNGYYPKVPITLRQLMSHTASTSESGGFSANGRKLSEMLTLSLNRRSNFHNYQPGSKYTYSNFGAGIAGAMMEAVTQQSVDAYMKKAVFRPLGIDAAYAASMVSNTADISNQYKDGSLYRAAKGQIEKGYEDFPDPENHYRTTAGQVWMRSRDLAKLGALLCGDGSIDGVRILSEESVKLMRLEQNTLGKSVTGESPYGLFLEHNDTFLDDRMVYGHQGMSEATILNLYFEPESQFVIALCQNGGSMVRQNRVGKLARNLFGYFYGIYGQP
ncbi:MAG: serine hydrolase [Clostridiales bacterium]|nr:serine hydrolase [Clostridiales bacterium]